jgi:hypothetical protein
MTLDSQFASQAIQKLLVGANLDEVRIGGIQGCLRFLNDSVIANGSTFVELCFCCSAYVVTASNTPSIEPAQEFHFARSNFLSDVYYLMGENVDGALVDKTGCLMLTFGPKMVVLSITAQDREADDWIWSVRAEDTANLPSSVLRRISYVVEGETEGVAGSFVGRNSPGVYNTISRTDD